MDKELLVSKFKEHLGTTKLSERTIGAYAEVILTGLKEEDVNDTFIAAHVHVLKEMSGQISYDASEEIRRYKEDFEKKNPVSKNDPPKTEPGDDMKAVLAKLNEIQAESKGLKERLDKQEQESARKLLHEKVERIMKEQGANDAYVLRNVMRDAQIDPSKNAEDSAKDLLSVYDREYKEAHGDGGQPRSSGGGKGGSERALDDYFARKASEGKFPKK